MAATACFWAVMELAVCSGRPRRAASQRCCTCSTTSRTSSTPFTPSLLCTRTSRCAHCPALSVQLYAERHVMLNSSTECHAVAFSCSLWMRTQWPIGQLCNLADHQTAPYQLWLRPTHDAMARIHTHVPTQCDGLCACSHRTRCGCCTARRGAALTLAVPRRLERACLRLAR